MTGPKDSVPGSPVPVTGCPGPAPGVGKPEIWDPPPPFAQNLEAEICSLGILKNGITNYTQITRKLHAHMCEKCETFAKVLITRSQITRKLHANYTLGGACFFRVQIVFGIPPSQMTGSKSSFFCVSKVFVAPWPPWGVVQPIQN